MVQVLVPANGVSYVSGVQAGVLALWGESDIEIHKAAREQYPDLALEEYRPAVSGELVYYAMEIPWDRIPVLELKKVDAMPFMYRTN